MRKIAIAFLVLGLAASFAVTPASATNLVSESFSYPNGNLVPNGGWANYSGAVTDIQVASGRATGGAIGNPANDDHKLFAAQPVTAQTYACFQVIIPAVAGAPKPIYFLELKDAGAANLVSRVYVLPLAGGGWTFGISHSSTSTTVGVTPWTAALSFDTPYVVAINYDPVAKSSTLWVNPVNQASPSVTDANPLIPALAVSGVGLRQSNAASALPASPPYAGTTDWNYSVDDLGVGTTFDDACNYGPTQTRSSTWGQVKTLYR
jgi:hypothetical protein